MDSLVSSEIHQDLFIDALQTSVFDDEVEDDEEQESGVISTTFSTVDSKLDIEIGKA